VFWLPGTLEAAFLLILLYWILFDHDLKKQQFAPDHRAVHTN